MSDTEYSDYHGVRAMSANDALALAASSSNFKAMKALLSDGVDIDGIALYSKSTPLCGAASLGCTRSVTFLLENGASVNLPGAHDMTPLMQACSFGKKKGFQIALQLIEAGADVNYVRKSDEMTALKFSIHGLNPEIVQLLIDNGADVDGPPGTDQTALMLAARNNNVGALKVLIHNGADRTLTCKLPWAGNRTAQGLAELEKRRQAVAFFKSLNSPEG
jgi:ankyrin repeat protein